jgi:NAD(P)-dependent dehydrogenase (short-subunit alcohol dehydrogenase family)
VDAGPPSNWAPGWSSSTSTDNASVAATAKTIEADGGLDVLINNAGIEERVPDGGVIGPAEVTTDMMRQVFETNVFGVVRVAAYSSGDRLHVLGSVSAQIWLMSSRTAV